MSPHRARGETIWRLSVPGEAGGWTIRSSGTRHRGTALAMDRMIAALGPRGRRDWDLLGAVTDRRLSLGQLYDAYRAHRLDRLRAELRDLDLQPTVVRWLAWLEDRVTTETRDRYRVHLASLHGDRPWLRSAFTLAAADRWLAERAVSAATKRKYAAALASFAGYAVMLGVVPENPVARLTAPPVPARAPTFLDLPDVVRVVAASAEPYRALFALLYGTGCDLSTALRLVRRHVDVATWEIQASGTKTAARDRVVLVAAWARPHVARACQGLLAEAPLFPGVTRYAASRVHRETLVRLGLRAAGPGVRGLRLHNARHHWAVRMIRSGTPVELVARQLGHADGTMALRIYGRWVPRREERDRWERRATEGET